MARVFLYSVFDKVTFTAGPVPGFRGSFEAVDVSASFNARW